MIIKIVGIKTLHGLSNVAKYIASDKDRIDDYREGAVFHNLSSTELPRIVSEFQSNYSAFAKRRIGANIGLHVILSHSPIHSDKLNRDIMDDVVRTYLNRAYPRAMAFAEHHTTERHHHSHILVSSNELMTSKSTRLSKADLRSIYVDMLRYIEDQYPELSHTFDLENWGKKKHSEKVYFEQRREREKEIVRDTVSDRVRDLFRQSENSRDFFDRLQIEGLATQTERGANNEISIPDQSRLDDIGISADTIDELDTQFERMHELEEIRNGFDGRFAEKDIEGQEYDGSPNDEMEVE